MSFFRDNRATVKKPWPCPFYGRRGGCKKGDRCNMVHLNRTKSHRKRGSRGARGRKQIHPSAHKSAPRKFNTQPPARGFNRKPPATKFGNKIGAMAIENMCRTGGVQGVRAATKLILELNNIKS